MNLSHLPNLLSFSRVLIALVVALFASSMSGMAVFLLVLFGVFSDVIDGYLARLLSCDSNFGARMDPICDAVFVSGVTIYVLRVTGLSMGFFFVLLVRYGVIAIYHHDLYLQGHRHLTSLWTGKWSSGLVMGLLLYMVARLQGVQFYLFDAVFPLVVLACCVLQCVSWYFYYQRYRALSGTT